MPRFRLFSSLCSKSPGRDGFPHQHQTLPAEHINLPLPGPPSQAQRFLPHHVSGIMLSHPASPHVHFFLPGNSPAVLIGNHPRNTPGTATRYLPFLFGTCFGALSLAAWESNASPSPYQAPYQQAPSQLPGAKLQQDKDLLLHPTPPYFPHARSTSPPSFSDSMSTPPTPSSCSRASTPTQGSHVNHLSSSLSSSLSNSLSSSGSRFNSDLSLGNGLSGSLSSSLGFMGLGSFGSRWGPSMREGYSSWMGMWPSWAAKDSHADAMHIIHPQPSAPSATSAPQSYTTHSTLPPPLPPPCTSSPQQATQSAVPPPLPSPYPLPCNNSSSSCSCSCCQEQHHHTQPVPLTRTSISDASARVAPAVVHLMVESAQPGLQQQQQQQQLLQQGFGVGGMGVVAPGRSSGSGFVYDARGFILTNAHVVEAAADDSQGVTTVGEDSRMGDSSSSNSSGGGGSGGSSKMNGWLGWGWGGSLNSSSYRSSGGAGGSSYSNSCGILRKRGVSEGGRSKKVPPGVLTVTLQDGRILKGSVVCLDRTADVAVVKVDSPEPLPVAPMGGLSKLRVGEWVVALGSPLMLKHSVTAGIVSCVERRGHELGLPGCRSAYIQTDVAINQGNSGGPLINLDGEVVGMSMMKAVAADGVSFCLPISSIQDIVSSFSVHGRMRYPYVGITMVEITNQGALRHVQPDLPELLGGSSTAIMVQSVRAGSPANAAGLQPEDIIVSLDGRTQLSMNDAVEHFGASIHKQCALGVLRRGVNADGTVGPYAMLSTHLTPSEHQQE